MRPRQRPRRARSRWSRAGGGSLTNCAPSQRRELSRMNPLGPAALVFLTVTTKPTFRNEFKPGESGKNSVDYRLHRSMRKVS